VRALPELLSEDPAWPLVESWLAESERDVVVVGTDRPEAEKTLLRLQVSTRSVLGAVVLHCGGLALDHGWIRILGSGAEGFPGLSAWNWGGAVVEGETVEGALVAANDVLGGVFAINDTAFSGEPGEIFYFAPDSLEWEPLGVGHSDFVAWAITGDLAAFYERFRWPGWEDEVAVVPFDAGIFFYPLLIMKESKPISHASRSVVSLRDLWRCYRDASRQLAGLPNGAEVRIVVNPPSAS
jgi:hypothetical protein